MLPALYLRAVTATIFLNQSCHKPVIKSIDPGQLTNFVYTFEKNVHALFLKKFSVSFCAYIVQVSSFPFSDIPVIMLSSDYSR